LTSLERARAAGPSRDETLRAALAYQELNDCPQAVAILTDLARADPRDWEVLENRGVCEDLMGEAQKSLADLQAAIGLNPRRWTAYLTIGAVYVAQGRFDDARRVYDSALALDLGPNFSPYHGRIVSARSELPAPRKNGS
jgi:tetratricopeptide (TPR) repeat protein